MTNEKQEVAVWTPQSFSTGSDLLPVDISRTDVVDRRGRDNIEERDMILPTLKVLTGTSPQVMQGMEGAKPGQFYMSGAERFFAPPLRLLLCAHYRSRALFPDERDDRSRSLETCISRDGLRGTTYGLCEECEYKNWGEGKNGKPPVCFESHNFVAITPFGPAVLRFAKTSYKAARGFLTEWNMSPKPMWAHPVVVKAIPATKSLPGGKQQPYFVLDMAWQRAENVPQAAQEAAWQIHQKVQAAHEAGKFGTDDEGEEALS